MSSYNNKDEILVERFCLYHNENLLLTENDWISYNDGYICIECSAIKNNKFQASIIPNIKNNLFNDASKSELQLHHISISQSTSLNDNSPAYQSSSNENSNFISLSKPYSKDFHEVLVYINIYF